MLSLQVQSPNAYDTIARGGTDLLGMDVRKLKVTPDLEVDLCVFIELHGV